MSRTLFALLVALFALLVAFPALGQDVEPPAQFNLSFQWRHDCDADGFGILRNLAEVPKYVPREDTGTWHISAGFSTDSELSCSEDEQRQFTREGRLPAALSALEEMGWPVDDQNIIKVTQEPIPGEAKVTVTWVPSAPEAPPAPAAPLAPDITFRDDTQDGRSGYWIQVNGIDQRFIANGVNGTSGSEGRAGRAGAWAFESFGISIGPDFIGPNPDIPSDPWYLATMAEVTFEIHISAWVIGTIVAQVGGPAEELGYRPEIIRPSFGAGMEIRFMPARVFWVGVGGEYDAYSVYKSDLDGDWYASHDNAGLRASAGLVFLPGKKISPTLSGAVQGGLGSNPFRLAAQVGIRFGSPDK